MAGSRSPLIKQQPWCRVFCTWLAGCCPPPQELRGGGRDPLEELQSLSEKVSLASMQNNHIIPISHVPLLFTRSFMPINVLLLAAKCQGRR